MPELPEVETVRKQLSRVLVGSTIKRTECGPPSYFFVTSPRTLKLRTTGRKVTSLARRGKALIATFDDDSTLLLHLGMTGQLVCKKLTQDGHVHLVFHLSRGRTVSFRDVRKFGKVEWTPAGRTSPRLTKLGPDALTIDATDLRSALSGRRVAIKSALLNQSLLAGVGNIYADEALFAAGIRPTRPARRLTKKESDALAGAIRSILARAVESGGSTINDYMRPDGELGGFQNWHQVYGKTGEPCPRCGAPLVRQVIGARSSHFCRKCQR